MALATGASIGRRGLAALVFSASMPALLSGCFFGGSKKKDDAPPPPKEAEKFVPLRLYGGVNLNADSSGRPLALLVRVYQLRSADTFQQMPFDTFLNPTEERASLGADLISSREVLLLPGQHYETTEVENPQTKFIGVVSLFRSPAQDRWRFAFNAKDSETSGITVGFQACAMTTTVGAYQAPASANGVAVNLNNLSEVHCQ